MYLFVLQINHGIIKLNENQTLVFSFHTLKCRRRRFKSQLCIVFYLKECSEVAEKSLLAVIERSDMSTDMSFRGRNFV